MPCLYAHTNLVMRCANLAILLLRNPCPEHPLMSSSHSKMYILKVPNGVVKYSKKQLIHLV
jgi:hypothetical protein